MAFETEVLIIGGGISGLSTAWWLARQGIRVEVWEADERPGGKIKTNHEARYVTEQAANLLVNFRPEINDLVRVSGLETNKRQRSDELNRYVIMNGQLAAVPMKPGAMMMSPLWSWPAKLRMLTEIVVPRGGHESESVTEFITRRLGREILESAIEPFVSGTMGSDPDLAEAQMVLPRLTALEKTFGSITMGMLINHIRKRQRANNADTFSFQNGMSELIDTLSASPGIHLRTSRRVNNISRHSGHWHVAAEGADQAKHISAQHLVISTPADSAATLLSSVDPHMASLLAGIEYAPITVLHMGLRKEQIKHPLDGTGFLAPRREHLGINGNLWMSSMFPERAPRGRTLLTTYLGGTRNRKQAELDPSIMVEQAMSELAPLLGIQGDPEYIRIDRHQRGLPLYHDSYHSRVRAISEYVGARKGLHLCANFMDGISVRERIFQGQSVAQQIAKELGATTEETLQNSLATVHF